MSLRIRGVISKGCKAAHEQAHLLPPPPPGLPFQPGSPGLGRPSGGAAKTNEEAFKWLAPGSCHHCGNGIGSGRARAGLNSPRQSAGKLGRARQRLGRERTACQASAQIVSVTP
eukprot:3954322-Pyramimonas_sp.AAC.1